jgi:hypothetical protein
MRTAVCCLLIIFLLPQFLKGQSKPVELSGIIIINGSNTLLYHLVFTTDTNGFLKGYSVTDMHHKDETKASIEGKIDIENQTLSYKETSVISPHTLPDTTIMCMVHAKLKYKKASKGMMLTGNFTGFGLNTGKECAKGNITMLNTDALYGVFNPSQKQNAIVPVAAKDSSKNIIPNLVDTFTTTDEITKGIETVYDWRSDTVLIDLWDGGEIDYDAVTILYNTDTILKNYTLKAEKIHLKVPVSSNGMDQLIIVADNEGNEPPNTANLTLTDDQKKYNVIAYNSVGQKAVINIKRLNRR